MITLARPGRAVSASLRLSMRFSSVFLGLSLALGGCGVKDSNLIVAHTDTPPPSVLTQPVIDAIDARPLGGASLTSGTSGGGTYEQAKTAGAIHLVKTLNELKTRVSGDTPSVVLVAEGKYTGAGAARTLQVCHQTCDDTALIPQQTLVAKNCAQTDALIDATFTTDTLRVGSNKTIIGLGRGARLIDMTVSLDGSANVILRNLSIEDVQSGVVGAGNGLSLEPANHVWLDHLSLRNISRTSLDVVSTWDEEDAQALVDESGYISVSHVRFDGFSNASCDQRSELVFTTNRNPAITITESWFDKSRIRSPALLGPGTWAHLFNNVWSDIDGRGLEVSCGAAAIAQGNVFQAAHNGLYNSDSGSPTWKFCATGYFGTLYAPTTTGADANQIDASSTVNLGGQPATGAGLELPSLVSGSNYEIRVPVVNGTRSETYRYTLNTDRAALVSSVQAEAGVGHLF